MIHQESEGPRGQCSEVGKGLVWVSHRAHVQTLELSLWVAMGNCSFLLLVCLLLFKKAALGEP